MVDSILHNNLLWIAGKYGIRVRGVLHVGGHIGPEAVTYDRFGCQRVVWIEGDPVVFRRLQENIKTYQQQEAYCCLVTEVDGERVRLQVANNNGQSSSVLEFDVRRIQREYPGLKVERIIELEGCRLNSFIRKNSIDLSPCNLLNLDVQGFELPVLKSLGRFLDGFEVVCAEVNLNRIYRGATLLHQLESFLIQKGFSRVWITVSGSQGEAWYVRRRTTLYNKTSMLISAYVLELLARSSIIKAVQGLGFLHSVGNYITNQRTKAE